MPGEPGFWAVLKHADVVHVARDPKLFSASEGGIMLEDARPRAPGEDAQHAPGDGPAAARRLPQAAGPSFKAQVIAGLEDRIRAICREIIDAVGDGDVEFVHDVTSSLPSQVIGELVGLPEEDWPTDPRLGRDEHLRPGPRHQPRGDDRHGHADSIVQMAMYAMEFAAVAVGGAAARTSPR